METKKNTSTKKNEKMTKPQKGIVILTAVVLAIILIVFAATQYMGSSNTYPIDTDVTTSKRTDSTVDYEKIPIPPVISIAVRMTRVSAITGRTV